MRAHLIALGRQSLVYGLSSAAIQLVGLVTLPVFARHFTEAQFGVLELATVGFAALIVAVDGGLGSAMQRNYFEVPADDEERRKLVVSTATLGTFALAVGLAAPLIVFSRQIAAWLLDDPKLHVVVLTVALSVPAGTLAIFLREIMRLHFRAGQYAASAILAAGVAGAFGLIGVLAYDAGVSTVVAGFMVGQIAAAIFGLVTVHGSVGLRFSREELRSLLSFGLPLIPAAVSSWAISFMDRIMLAQLDGLAATGQYAIGSRFASVLLLSTGAFGMAYLPFLFDLHASDPERERAVRRVVMTYAAAGFMGIAVVLAAFAREVASVVAPGYDDAYTVVGVLCFGAAAFALTPITAAGISLARRTRYVASYTGIAMIANLALCLVLIPPFGLVGAACATAATYCGLAVAYLHRSERLAPAGFESGKALRVFLLGAALMPVGFLDLSPEGLTLALKALAPLAFVAGLWLLRVFGDAEVAELRRVAARFRRPSLPRNV